MVTPFAEDGSLDLTAARSLARHLVGNGSEGLVLAGTTGESPTLSDGERVELLEAVRDELGDAATLIAGTGFNDTRHSIAATEEATRAGADAVLVVTPYYNKPNPAGVRAHFEAVAAATDLPVVLYNIPSRCVINVSREQLADLARIPNIVAVKQANDEELGPVEGLAVLAGNDNTFLRCLESGGAGGILVASHLVGPEMAEIRDAVEAGDLDRAREVNERLEPFYEAMAVTSNPIPVKTGLEMVGIAPGTMRLPMVPADDSQRAVIRDALSRQGLLAAA
jgi:4-hydroxy-tetrahydrodipicolinate synthase